MILLLWAFFYYAAAWLSSKRNLPNCGILKVHCRAPRVFNKLNWSYLCTKMIKTVEFTASRCFLRKYQSAVLQLPNKHTLFSFLVKVHSTTSITVYILAEFIYKEYSFPPCKSSISPIFKKDQTLKIKIFAMICISYIYNWYQQTMT